MRDKTTHRFLLFISLVLTLFLIQSVETPLFAQANETITPISLDLNKTVTGQLRGISDTVAYVIELPADEDVVLEYRANKLVSMSQCLMDEGSNTVVRACGLGGGSGGDRAVAGTGFLSSNGKTGQRVAVSFYRPLDGAANFQITSHTIKPQPVVMGEQLDYAVESSQRYQVYTLEADPEIPFTVDIEEQAANGNFLWVVSEPYSQSILPTTDNMLPTYVDGAFSGTELAMTDQLYLYYLGGRDFRVMVKSSKDYVIRSASAFLPALDENQTIEATVSFQQPVLIARLNSQPNIPVKIKLDVIDGAGAQVTIQEEGTRVYKSLTLGSSASYGPFPLSGEIEITSDKALYVIIRIPYTFTREKVTVAISWQQA